MIGKAISPVSRVLLGGLALLLLLYVARAKVLPLVGSFLDIGGRPVKTDFVMILNGDAETRPFVAAALMRKGFAEDALVATVPQSERAQRAGWKSQDQLVRAVLQHGGISAERIHTLGAVENTFQEAQALGRFLQSHPGATVTVVTNDYHSRRARWVIRRVLESGNSRVHFVTAPTNGFNQSNWWLFETGLVLYVTEYGKLMFYLARYGNLIWWTAALAVVLAAVISRKYLIKRPALADAVQGDERN
jgi:uncharacterized SAM-binding protein YcdF (DUF218 family)